MEWIDVDDWLPPLQVQVFLLIESLVEDCYGITIHQGYFFGNDPIFFSIEMPPDKDGMTRNITSLDSCKVTHWCILPKLSLPKNASQD